MNYSVGQVAKIARVTVRTLHHYDEIGLLHPSGRLDSGYGSYSMADLERLQRVLCYRQLGFPLDHITAVLDDQQTRCDGAPAAAARLAERADQSVATHGCNSRDVDGGTHDGN